MIKISIGAMAILSWLAAIGAYSLLEFIGENFR
jgi:hypothetical protein